MKEHPALHLFFSHALTSEQEQDARESLGIGSICPLPPALQSLWSNIPPEAQTLDEILKPLLEYLVGVARAGDFVLVSGDFGASVALVSFAKANDLVPIYATTKRESLEERQSDGSIVRSSRFVHVRFRRYP